MSEREQMEVDVLFVGGGPANLCGMLRLHQLIEQHDKAADGGEGQKIGDLTIMLIEKGASLGAHSFSGAILDPRAISELMPGWLQSGMPVEAAVPGESIYYLTETGKFKLPITPPPLQNHGNYVISLSRLTRWLGEQAEKTGWDVLPEFPGAEILVEGERVTGVRTGDKGIDVDGKQKPNYEPGVDLLAKVTVLGEGVRGSLTKQVVEKLKLDAGKQPQTYATAIKEIWEVPEGRLTPGTVVHTMGYPLKSETYGGSFVYHMTGNRVAVGLVVGLDYRDPLLDPHHEFQRFKMHPLVKELLKDGKCLEYGAKCIPMGGYLTMPKLSAPGLLLVGDSAGFLNTARLKGVHLAMKSGMMAAETIFECLKAGDFSGDKLKGYEERFEKSWAWEELFKFRNFHQAFENGLFMGMFRVGVQMALGGSDLFGKNLPTRPGHTHMKKLKEYYPGGVPQPRYVEKYDDVLTFDKLKDVYMSGTIHEERQPPHLKIQDTNLCVTRCREEFGNPCEKFCPASVYEIVEDGGASSGRRMQINFSNCVHCKTCDIMDPYQVITWTTPEGGGGPAWKAT